MAPPPPAPKKSYALFIFGCILLIIVDFLWTLSSVIVQKLLDEYYNKPIIITYCSTFVFVLYIPIFYGSNWLRTFFYSCRIRRALRERYQYEDSLCNATETTSLIGNNVSSSSSKKNQSSSAASSPQLSSSTLPGSSLPLSPSSGNVPLLPYNQSSDGKSNCDDSCDVSNRPSNGYDFANLTIDERISRDMEYTDGIHADKDSQLYHDIRSYRVLYNERAWKVFWHNFKTAAVLGPVWYTMNVTYNSALKMVSVSTNTILSTTAGFFVLLIGLVVFCIPVRKLHLLCVLLAIFGSFLVVVMGSKDDDSDPDQPHTLFDKVVGPSLCLLSAFLYGLYSVVIEYFTDKEKPLDEQKDSITKQRKEAEEEEANEKKLAEAHFYHLTPQIAPISGPIGIDINQLGGHHSHSQDRLTKLSSMVPSSSFLNQTDQLSRSHSINNLNRGQYTALDGGNDVSVHVQNHLTGTSSQIDENDLRIPESFDQFGFGHCREQQIVEHIRANPNVSYDELHLSLVDSDDDDIDGNDGEKGGYIELPPNNYDPNDPKLITGLLFGCVGLINLVFAWPFIGLFHFSGFETLQFPDSRAIPMIVMNSLLGAAASDFLWANAVILTSPIIATLTIPGTIPIAMCYETFFLHKPLSLYAVLGSILIVASSSVVTIHQYNEDKKYDKMTKKMLEKREEKKQKEKIQRRQFRERQRQLRELALQTKVTNSIYGTGAPDGGITHHTGSVIIDQQHKVGNPTHVEDNGADTMVNRRQNVSATGFLPQLQQQLQQQPQSHQPRPENECPDQ